jgi:hypothetical protein
MPREFYPKEFYKFRRKLSLQPKSFSGVGKLSGTRKRDQSLFSLLLQI